MSSHAVKEYTPLNVQTSTKPKAQHIHRYVAAAVISAALFAGWAKWPSWVSFGLSIYGTIPVYGPSSVSIILTADNGDMVGTSEGGEIKALMAGVTTLTYDTDNLFCENVFHGQLFGSDVMLVTTGIGHDRAALCLRSLLQRYHGITKEIMFLGTGGFSPARGGIVNSVFFKTPSHPKNLEILRQSYISRYANFDNFAHFASSIVVLGGLRLSVSRCHHSNCTARLHMHFANDYYMGTKKAFVRFFPRTKRSFNKVSSRLLSFIRCATRFIYEDWSASSFSVKFIFGTFRCYCFLPLGLSQVRMARQSVECVCCRAVQPAQPCRPLRRLGLRVLHHHETRGRNDWRYAVANSFVTGV